MYVKPQLQRFGTLREITQGGGPQDVGDATNVYHRS
ncbi:MAG: lasso RiPP family leader peptide-containing protein [Gemmatimonadaceae bacterium]